MKKRPEITADRFTSRITVVASNGDTCDVSRNHNGDYSIYDAASDITIFIGPAEVIGQIAEAINDLLAANEDEA